MCAIDLRDEKEREIERRAKSPLGKEDEEIAQKLVTLIRQANAQYSSDKAAYDKTFQEIKEIGESLCANGGDHRMKLIAYRGHALGVRVRDFEFHWDGVCGWMK